MTLWSVCPLAALVWLAQATEPLAPPPRRPPPLGAPAARAWVPAPLKARETARYRVTFGGVEVGEFSITVHGKAVANGGDTIRLSAQGQGALLGLGRVTSSLDAELDPIGLMSRRWTTLVKRGDGGSRVVADQRRPGYVTLHQSEGGGTRRLETFMRGPVLDPVGFLARLRAQPPGPGASPAVLRVLQERYLWRATLRNQGSATVDEDGRSTPAVRLEGRLEPIYYDGTPARDGRSGHTLVMWLRADETRLPLRLEVSYGVGTVTIRLTGVDRDGLR